MDARQMQISFVTLLENSGVTTPLVSDDIFRHLNDGQDLFVRQRFEQFETNASVLSELETLVVKDEVRPVLWGGESAQFHSYQVDYTTLPDNLQYLLSARAAVYFRTSGLTTTLTEGKRIPEGQVSQMRSLIRISQTDDIYRLLDDPFGRTTYREPLADISGHRLNIYTDSRFVVDWVYCNYIKVPQRIRLALGDDPAQASDLPDFTHPLIVQLAVDLFLQRVGQPTG